MDADFAVFVTLLAAAVIGCGGNYQYATDPHCKSSSIPELVDTTVDLMNKVKTLCSDMTRCSERPMDCDEVLRCGRSQSGVYSIWPHNRLVTGRMQVVQRRGDFGHSKDNFFQEWAAYKIGFGHVEQDFWLGNDNIYAVSNQRQYSIRFDLKDLEGEKRFALYDHFWIDNEGLNYTLHVKGYSGNAGNSFEIQNGNQFSTKDRDNDINPKGNCAVSYKGAWWYASCHSSNLNGYYFKGYHSSYADGVGWRGWRGLNYSLPWTEMKIRPLFFKMESVTPL